jgi:hypothetical protein
MHGNNLQTWRDIPSDAALAQAVALGIREADTRHLHTSELDFFSSGSLDDETWRPILGLNGSFTYFPTYAQVLEDYNRTDFLPTFLIEANYEHEGEGTDIQTLRRQAYWALLSGAAGHMYGDRSSWLFLPDWRVAINDVGAKQMQHVKSLFSTRAWYDLVPDQGHLVVTSGLGTFADSGSILANDYLTAAATPDGTLAMAYLPTNRTITVDMSNFAAAARVRWFDPTNGTFSNFSSSTPNSGILSLSPPAFNSEGSEDWVLVIETN